MSEFGSPTPPQPSRLIVPGTDAARAPRCSKCGGEMPPLSAELAALARAAGGVALSHDVCPGEQPAGPEGRYFEVRVQIVEVVTEENMLDPQDPDVRVTELISFKAGLRAIDLDSAMRPLALALGERWQAAEKQAAVADSVTGS